MAGYLTLEQFKLQATLPSEFIDQLETEQPGFTQTQLDLESSRIDARLRKRYQAPFADPTPLIVQDWLSKIVTLTVWLRRGTRDTDQAIGLAEKQSQQAFDEIKEAADAEKGLFDLPLRQDTLVSGITRPKVRSYSETSPFLSQRNQALVGRQEDRDGQGTRR
jgi:hypothetical protein